MWEEGVVKKMGERLQERENYKKQKRVWEGETNAFYFTWMEKM